MTTRRADAILRDACGTRFTAAVLRVERGGALVFQGAYGAVDDAPGSAAANVTSAAEPAAGGPAAGVRDTPIAPTSGGISRAADPEASATPPVIGVTAGVPAVESGTSPDRRGAGDRLLCRSPGPSFGLMTRAYVSPIASHAAPYRFMPKHQCFMRIV